MITRTTRASARRPGNLRCLLGTQRLTQTARAASSRAECRLAEHRKLGPWSAAFLLAVPLRANAVSRGGRREPHAQGRPAFNAEPACSGCCSACCSAAGRPSPAPTGTAMTMMPSRTSPVAARTSRPTTTTAVNVATPARSAWSILPTRQVDARTASVDFSGSCVFLKATTPALRSVRLVNVRVEPKAAVDEPALCSRRLRFRAAVSPPTAHRPGSFPR